MGPQHGALIYQVQNAVHASSVTQTRKKWARAQSRGPYFDILLDPLVLRARKSHVTSGLKRHPACQQGCMEARIHGGQDQDPWRLYFSDIGTCPVSKALLAPVPPCEFGGIGILRLKLLTTRVGYSLWSKPLVESKAAL